VKTISDNADIDVQISEGLLSDVFGMVFDPFSAPHEAMFLRIPTRKNEGSQGFPALLQKITEASDNSVERGRAGDRVAHAVDPGIAMSTEDDFFFLPPWYPSNYVIYRDVNVLDVIDKIDD
jgi:hypothetical protein